MTVRLAPIFGAACASQGAQFDDYPGYYVRRIYLARTRTYDETIAPIAEGGAMADLTTAAERQTVHGIVESATPWATLAGWGKSIFVAVAAVVMAGYAAYTHFATAAEVDVLRCAMLRQHRMNEAVAQASSEIKVTLKILRGELLSPSKEDGQKATLAQNLAEALGNIEKAMNKSDAVRLEMTSAALTKSGSQQCGQG